MPLSTKSGRLRIVLGSMNKLTRREKRKFDNIVGPEDATQHETELLMQAAVRETKDLHTMKGQKRLKHGAVTEIHHKIARLGSPMPNRAAQLYYPKSKKGQTIEKTFGHHIDHVFIAPKTVYQGETVMVKIWGLETHPDFDRKINPVDVEQLYGFGNLGGTSKYAHKGWKYRPHRTEGPSDRKVYLDPDNVAEEAAAAMDEVKMMDAPEILEIPEVVMEDAPPPVEPEPEPSALDRPDTDMKDLTGTDPYVCTESALPTQPSKLKKGTGVLRTVLANQVRSVLEGTKSEVMRATKQARRVIPKRDSHSARKNSNEPVHCSVAQSPRHASRLKAHFKRFQSYIPLRKNKDSREKEHKQIPQPQQTPPSSLKNQRVLPYETQHQCDSKRKQRLQKQREEQREQKREQKRREFRQQHAQNPLPAAGLTVVDAQPSQAAFSQGPLDQPVLPSQPASSQPQQLSAPEQRIAMEPQLQQALSGAVDKVDSTQSTKKSTLESVADQLLKGLKATKPRTAPWKKMSKKAERVLKMAANTPLPEPTKPELSAADTTEVRKGLNRLWPQGSSTPLPDSPKLGPQESPEESSEESPLSTPCPNSLKKRTVTVAQQPVQFPKFAPSQAQATQPQSQTVQGLVDINLPAPITTASSMLPSTPASRTLRHSMSVTTTARSGTSGPSGTNPSMPFDKLNFATPANHASAPRATQQHVPQSPLVKQKRKKFFGSEYESKATPEPMTSAWPKAEGNLAVPHAAAHRPVSDTYGPLTNRKIKDLAEEVPKEFFEDAIPALQGFMEPGHEFPFLEESHEIVRDMTDLVKHGPGASVDTENFTIKERAALDMSDMSNKGLVGYLDSFRKYNPDLWEPVFKVCMLEAASIRPHDMLDNCNRNELDGLWGINWAMIDSIARSGPQTVEEAAFMAKNLGMTPAGSEKVEKVVAKIKNGFLFCFWESTSHWAVEEKKAERMKKCLRAVGFCPDADHDHLRRWLTWLLTEGSDELKERCLQVVRRDNSRFLADVQARIENPENFN